MLVFKYIKIIALITGIILISLALVQPYNQYKIYKTQPVVTIKDNRLEAEINSIQNITRDILKDTEGDYSVYIKDLKTQATYELNADKQYNAASLYKLWVMATAFDQINKGTLAKTETLSENVENLNKMFNIDLRYADLKNKYITLTVEQTLKNMITFSDNNSALLLSKRVTVNATLEFIKKYNFTNTTMGTTIENPVTSAKDIGLFFEKLHYGDIITPGYSIEMIDLLKQQKLNTKLPKYLPKDTAIAHKTGELDNYSHDAGIVYLKNEQAYVISILTKTKNVKIADEKIARLSEALYNYFSAI